MSLSIIRCKHCQNDFQSDLENCPHCRKRSPLGRRILFLKWIAVVIFLLVLAYIVHMVLVSQGGL